MQYPQNSKQAGNWKAAFKQGQRQMKTENGQNQKQQASLLSLFVIYI